MDFGFGLLEHSNDHNGEHEGQASTDSEIGNDAAINTTRSSSPPPTFHPSSWDLITCVKMNEEIPVSKFRSPTTSFEIVHAHVPSPLIHCYFVIPHQLEDDTGIPHLLQNIIWHGGSKHYPYFGLFHHITNLCFSVGVQFWTELDHSCYHLKAAGVEGFAQMLPVVFDHLMSPTLQEASFLNKIFHIDKEGQEKGECYENVLRLEKDPVEVATQELIRHVFGVDSNYRHTVYGSSKKIRTMDMDMLDKMKEFHNKWYHLDNCCMVAVGDIGKEDLFSLLQPIISLPRYKKRENWIKPWINEPDVSIADPVMSQVEYPATEHMVAFQRAPIVKVGILGPASCEKINRVVAIRLVLEYLVSGPLIETLINKKQRASVSSFDDPDKNYNLTTTLSISEHEYKQVLFCVEFHNVPMDMVSAVPSALRTSLEEQLESGAFDFEHMKNIIERVYEEEVTEMETNIHEKIVHAVIPDYIYLELDSGLMFDRRVNHAYTVHQFRSMPPEFWQLVIRGILDTPWATVAAVPSSKLYEKMKKHEEKRIKNRMKPINLKETRKLAYRYTAACKLYSRLPPPELFELFPLPSVGSIGCTHIRRSHNPKWASDTLCNLYVDDINSSFVFLTIIMDTTELTLDEKKHLVLFSEGLLHSPFIDSSDKYHSAEEMRAMIELDIIRYETWFGLEWCGRPEDRTKFSCGSSPHLFCLRILLDTAKIQEGFAWARNILWNTKWQADTLRHICFKLYREVEDELKGLGPVMTRAILTDSLYLMNSNPKCISLIRQKLFLRKIGLELPRCMKKLAHTLESIRMTILRPENCTVHVAGSLKKMEFYLETEPNQTNTTEAIARLFKQTFDYTGWHWGYDTRRLANAPDTTWMRSPDCIARCAREQILRMTLTGPQQDREVPEYTLGCLIQAAPCIKSWQDPDYPLILTALQYFIQKDGGPFQQEIVDAGLADDVDIRVNASEGMIYFEMRNSKNIAAAYGKAYDIIAKHCLTDPNDSAPNTAALGTESTRGSLEVEVETPSFRPEEDVWSNLLLYGAKNSMIFRLCTEESNPQYVAMLSLLSYFKGTPQLGTPRRKLMQRISEATLSEVHQATMKYLKPLFLEPCTAAASAPKEDAIPIIKELMDSCGKRLTLIPPVEQSSLASYNQ